MKVELELLIELESLLYRFLKLFQIEEPLIHLLHEDVVELIKSFMRRFLKTECFKNKSCSSLKKLDNHLSDNKVEFGENTRTTLKTLKSDKQKLSEILPASSCIFTEKVANKFWAVTRLEMFAPLLQKEEKGVSYIRRIAHKNALCHFIWWNSICNRWMEGMYGNKIPKDWIEKEIDNEGQIVFHIIDFFWNTVLQAKTGTENVEFKSLGNVVWSALCLAHGNAEVERSLSENKRTVTSDRTLLSDSSLNGLRMIKVTVKGKAEGKVHMMPISNALKQAGQHAYQWNTKRGKRKQRKGSETKRNGEERSRKVRRGKKTIGASKDEFKRQKN